MKPWYAYSTPEGINLIEGDKMPKPEDFAPFSGDGSATERAKASGVLVTDQVMAIKKILYSLGISTESASLEDLQRWHIRLGTIYGPFNLRYRIEDACAHDSCPVDGKCERCKEPVKVAILYDDTPEKEESQESELVKLRKFKQYVHDRLDKMGIPADPEPDNNAAHGCRIEGRLNVVERILG